MTTDAVSGLTVVLTVDGAAVGATRDYTFTINQAVIDTTSDDAARWETLLASRRDWSMDIGCLYIYNDAAQVYIEEHLTEANPTSIALIWTLPDGRTFTGTALVTSYAITRAYEEVITMSVSLKGTGPIVTSTS